MKERTVQRRRVVLAGRRPAARLPAVAAALLWGTSGALTAVGAAGPADPGAVVALAAAAAAWVVLTWLTARDGGGAGHRRGGRGRLAGPRHGPRPRAGRGPPARVRRARAGDRRRTGRCRPARRRRCGQRAHGCRPGGPRTAGRLDLPATPEPDRPAATVPAGWTPDRPVPTHRRSAHEEAAARLVTGPARAERRVADEVVVRRGDTLWDIAARHLGPDASAAEVAAEWPRWHAANRDVIGARPRPAHPRSAAGAAGRPLTHPPPATRSTP